ARPARCAGRRWDATARSSCTEGRMADVRVQWSGGRIRVAARQRRPHRWATFRVMFDLTGRVAVVTGAGQNVGAGIARLLAAQGATVHINDIVEGRAKETVAQITAAGGSAATAPFDVTDY